MAAKNKYTGKSVKFADPDDGKAIQFTREGTDENGQFLGHQFDERIGRGGEPYIISDEILDSVFNLEDCVKRASYDEVYLADTGMNPDEVKEEEEDDYEESEKVGEEYVDGPPDISSKGDVNECGFGYKFGLDLNNHPECNNCDDWDDCRARKNEAS